MNANLGGQTSRDQWEALPTGFTPYQSQMNTPCRAPAPVASSRVYRGHLWAFSFASSTFSTELVTSTERLKGARHGLPSPNQGDSLIDYLEDQMTAAAVEHEAVLNDLLLSFVMPTDSSVTTFLTEHRSIPQILLESVPHLKTCFGSGTVFALRAPIDDSGSRTLYAVVIWPGKVRGEREALEQFDDSWWIAHSRQASGHLTFTYELV